MIGFHCYKIEALAPDNRKITSMKVANLPTSRSRNVSFTNTQPTADSKAFSNV